MDDHKDNFEETEEKLDLTMDVCNERVKDLFLDGTIISCAYVGGF